jgi:multiple sugar transport system substrate-binding protein
MLEPDVLLPMFNQTGYIPIQKIMMNGTYFQTLNESVPYFDELVSMVFMRPTRTNIPQYPRIADCIRVALNEVFDGPKNERRH